MSAALHHYRGTDAACGGHARAGMRRLAGNGDQFQSVESKAAAPRLGKVATDLSRLFFGLRGGRFSHRRQANSLILLPGERLAATQFRVGAVQGSRVHLPQTHFVETGLHQPEAQPSHHLERLSSMPVAYVSKHRSRDVGKPGFLVGAIRNV